jgi:hypothetical protein
MRLRTLPRARLTTVLVTVAAAAAAAWLGGYLAGLIVLFFASR